MALREQLVLASFGLGTAAVGMGKDLEHADFFIRRPPMAIRSFEQISAVEIRPMVRRRCAGEHDDAIHFM